MLSSWGSRAGAVRSDHCGFWLPPTGFQTSAGFDTPDNRSSRSCSQGPGAATEVVGPSPLHGASRRGLVDARRMQRAWDQSLDRPHLEDRHHGATEGWHRGYFDTGGASTGGTEAIWPLRAPPRHRPRVPQPDQLCRPITIGDRRIQTPTTPSIVMSLFARHAELVRRLNWL